MSTVINQIRTRFAPSPTGYFHIGSARTALFSWAFARHFNGIFILRIEDTDTKRSTPEAIQAIITGMQWLGLDYDIGPVFQMQRIKRYREVITHMLQQGTAYYCYCSSNKIAEMRKRQRAVGKKPRYDGTCRPEFGKILPKIPEGQKPVVRFRNPLSGVVSWNDIVKGQITIANCELDDLIIARFDNTPTYNFCVVVDDLDMKITHVIRGDDHINNTPRQINILRALNNVLPQYAHVPMILGIDGEKLSKRHGAVSILEYLKKGYLPEALLNYLARQGWSHANEEIFSMKNFCAWFNLKNLSKSPAQFNIKKLNWLNSYYIKLADNKRLEKLIRPFLEKTGIILNSTPPLLAVISLLKKRINNLNELIDAVLMIYHQPSPDPILLNQYITEDIKQVLRDFEIHCATVNWQRESLALMLKKILIQYKLNMSQLAMPLRLIIVGQLQTPAIDVILELFGRDIVLKRLKNFLH